MNELLGKTVFSVRHAALVSLCALGFGVSPLFAVDYDSANDGAWNAGGVWSPDATPDTGGTATGADSVTIDGHDITFNLAQFPGAGDATVRNGNSITIRGGGSLTQVTDLQHIRIGDGAGAVSGNGTLNIEDGTFNLGTANAVQMGIRGGTATVNVGDGIGAAGSAVLSGGTGTRELRMGSSSSGGPTGNANIVVESDGRIDDMWMRVAAQGGTSTIVVNGNGSINTRNSGSNDAIGESGNGTVTLNGNAVLTANAADGLRVGGNNGSTGTLNLTGNSTLNVTENVNSSARALGIGYAGNGTLNISDSAAINANTQIFVGRDASGVGQVNQTGGSVYAQYPIGLARVNGATGNWLLTDGTVTTPERFDVGHDGNGTFTQDGGTASTPRVRLGVAGTANGTYNLNGGTLRTDNIDMNLPGTGLFNWDGGTLTMYEVNSGSSGNTDYTLANISPLKSSPAQVGTVITIDGDLSTAGNTGVSTLDLGSIYKGTGNRFDQLVVTGDLNLSGNDVLTAIGSGFFLRPSGGQIDYGTLPLITANSITGNFDSFTPLSTELTQRFVLSGFSVNNPDDLLPNTYFLENTGSQLLFHYKVVGTVPEPSTISFLVLGVFFMRFIRKSLHAKK